MSIRWWVNPPLPPKKGGSVPVLEDGKSGATLRSPKGFQAQHCAPRCRNHKCKACRGIQSSRYNMTQCAISSMNMSNTSNYARTGGTPQKCERLHISEHCELFSFDLPRHVHEIKCVCLNFKDAPKHAQTPLSVLHGSSFNHFPTNHLCVYAILIGLKLDNNIWMKLQSIPLSSCLLHHPQYKFWQHRVR